MRNDPVRQPAIFFITGASGSGKTTLLTRLAEQADLPGANYHFFDDIGIPSAEVMQRDFGGPERWQEHATHRWVDRLLDVPESLAIIEGSTRPQFILAAFRRAKVARGGVLLLDCGLEERQRRLQTDRGQPELANFHMFAWAAYLRGQADALGVPVLDTTALSEEDACQALAKRVWQFAHPGRPRNGRSVTKPLTRLARARLPSGRVRG